MATMQPWTDSPVDQFRIKFFLDTNILSYLIDKTYSGVLITIDYLKESQFCDLVSSNYVIFEFVGIRKREHYLRQVVNKTKSSGGDINMSSLLKYKDGFEAAEAKFTDVQAVIQTNVETEVKKIVNDFGILYENNLLHNRLISPTFDINLKSRISKEDSLVLVSCLWPDELTKESFVLLISNDAEFVRGYMEANLDDTFTQHTLNKPLVEQARAMQLNGANHVNLTVASEDAKLVEFLPLKVKELLIQKNRKFFLGNTISCGKGANFPRDVVCFELNANTLLDKGLFITFIGKDLDFIYTSRIRINDFWNQKAIGNYPFQNASSTNISFKILDLDANNLPIVLDPVICSKLREPGNLVFINPDSFI